MKTSTRPKITIRFELEVEALSSLPCFLIVTFITIPAPIFSNSFYQDHEILKQHARYASSTANQTTGQAGRQAPLPQYAWRFVPGARCVLYVYTAGPARELRAGPSLLVMWYGVCLREQRETRLPLNCCSRSSGDGSDNDDDGGGMRQWCMILSFSIPSRDREPGSDKSKNRDEAKPKESWHEFTCVYASD